MWGYSQLSKLSVSKESPSFLCKQSLSRGLTVLAVDIGLIFLALGLWGIFSQPEKTPVIKIADGLIQGNVKYSRDGHEFWEFLGIPYAQPPVGARKFQPPREIEPWGEVVKQTTKYPPPCVQFNVILESVEGEMDCLFLNVFASRNGGSGNMKLMPVLVYIYGGGFVSGGSHLYHPDYIMDRDVVLVVMNYRLGPYGFLNLEAPGDPPVGAAGNMGLKDQTLVLKWIQKNIQKFNGDPNAVTLLGTSAGAVSANLLVLSPMSQGLFHRAVMQSGVAISPFGFSFKPKKSAELYARRMGCSTETTAEVFKCFNDTDWREVVRHQLPLLDPFDDTDYMFLPSLDSEFLPQKPIDILKSGNFPKMPTMWGVNSGEGGFRGGRFEAMPELIPELDQNWVELSGNVFFAGVRPALSTIIRQKYLGHVPKFTENVEEFKRGVMRVTSDGGFFIPMQRSAVFHAKVGAPAYLYFFNYTSNVFPGTYNLYRTRRASRWVPQAMKIAWTSSIDLINEFVFGRKTSVVYGVCHAEDIVQLWNINGMTKWCSGKDSEFSHSFVNAIVDFASSTEPLTFRNVVWPSITDSDNLTATVAEYKLPYMLMDNSEQPKVIPDPIAEGRKLFGPLVDWKDYD